MSKKSYILSVLLTFNGLFAFAADDKAVSDQKARQYPGGRDEEELKVQDSVTSPQLIVDRRSIEQKVLKNYFKKTDEEAGAKSGKPEKQ